MDGMTVLWIVVALAAIVILVALIAGAVRKSSHRRAERNRQVAYEQEQQARTSAVHAEKQQAAADEVDARARKAQAVADEKAAEARRLAAGASERQEAAESARIEAEAHRNRAQELHPDQSSPHAATWGKDRGEAGDQERAAMMRDGDDREGAEGDRSGAWGRDGQPTDEHWADGTHPNDPRRQPWPENPEPEEPDDHPKHSRY